MKIIARISTDLPSKFGLPRQSGLVEGIEGRIVFEREYRNAEAFRGLEDFSHIWILWQFSEAVRDDWSPTVRPPMLGGNKRVGVFATRSPFRPNSLGLSVLKLEGIEKDPKYGHVLVLSGADMMDSTPVYDIKPYLPFADCVPEASGGFTDTLGDFLLEVNIPSEIKDKLSSELYECLVDCLKNDPRPSYIDTPSRVFGFPFDKYEVKFTVEGKHLTVLSVDEV